MKSRMAFEPRFDPRVLMQIQTGWVLLINEVEKLNPLLTAVAVHTRGNDIRPSVITGQLKGWWSHDVYSRGVMVPNRPRRRGNLG
jgi:hypothetical protein